MEAKILGLISAAILALPIGAAADSVRQQPDGHILAKLHFMNISQIDAVELGYEKACAGTVLHYALDMGEEHLAMDRSARQMAETKSVSVNSLSFQPWEIQSVNSMRAKVDRLERMTTCRFDRLFLVTMRDAHNFTAQMLALAIAAETDVEVRAFLTSYLTVVRNLRQTANKLLAELKPQSDRDAAVAN